MLLKDILEVVDDDKFNILEIDKNTGWNTCILIDKNTGRNLTDLKRLESAEVIGISSNPYNALHDELLEIMVI